MRVTFLGTGTSTGVPVLGCRCPVCTSSKTRNHRLRSSVYVQVHGRDSGGPDSAAGALVIDTSTDFRQQCLRAGITRLDAVLYTHAHADHVYGIDDLRPFNFLTRKVMPLFADEQTATRLEVLFRYAFFPDPDYQGGAPPNLALTRIAAYTPFPLFGVQVLPLALKHGDADITGYRIGRFAYLTDCSSIPEDSQRLLKDLDVLVLDGLRPAYHKTHFNHQGAVEQVERLKPKKAYLTHMSHDIDHDEANAALAEMTGCDIELAYDGLMIDL